MHVESLLLALEMEFQKNDMHTSREIKIVICKFLILLQRWNTVHNLTAHKDENLMITEHVIDSLSALVSLKKKLMNLT